MITKKFTKLVGIKKEEFDNYVIEGQIQLQPARLIPLLKVGDEMALASIFLSTLRLVKEYRDEVFKALKLSKGGKIYYYREVSFPDCFPNLGNIRIDGLIIVVKSGAIKEAAFFEMKSKSNGIEQGQIEKYLEVSKKLGVNSLVTVSNEFVADPSQSPLKIKPPKAVNLFHFSWTYLLTIGQLLLFKNESNIQDADQIEIMREVLEYFENPLSGVSGHTQMKPGWKQLVDDVNAQKPLKVTDEYLSDAVLSWYELEKDMSLLMSRNLGVLVKCSQKGHKSLKEDVTKVKNENIINGILSVKNSVSDIKITGEIARKNVIMSIKVTPPLDKGTIARITWIGKQLENCSKRSPEVFEAISKDIFIEADVKYIKEHEMVSLKDVEKLKDVTNGKEILAFNVLLNRSFGVSFSSNKKFVENIEKMVLEYYEGIVQHMSSWNKPAPKLVRE